MNPLAQLKAMAGRLGVPLDARGTETAEDKRQADKRKRRNRARDRMARASRRRNRR